MRTVKEWIGRSDDTPVPPRVRLRVFERDGRHCQCGCGLEIRAGDKWDTHHIKALINGGENRETNLHTQLTEHHKETTKQDMAEKSKTYERKRKHYGVKPPSRFPCGRNSPWKMKIGGKVVPR